MRVTMMLADYVQVADGKLTIVGGGWSVTGPQPVPFGVALLFQVPWDRANMKHHFRLELVDADGEPVSISTEEGDAPLLIEGEFESGRPPGLRPGTPLEVPMAINVPGAPVPPGGRYEWRLAVNGRSHEDWRLAFSTRPDTEGAL